MHGYCARFRTNNNAFDVWYLFVLQGKIAGGENRGLVMQDGFLQMIFSADYSVHTAVEFEK